MTFLPQRHKLQPETFALESMCTSREISSLGEILPIRLRIADLT
jgi:hypothetical protein